MHYAARPRSDLFCREREEVAAAAAGVDERMLRGYQADMINLAAQGGNLIFVAPTGAGKVG